MATSQMNGVIQHLRRAVLLRDCAGMTDEQLLTDYISRHDEAALAALVQRHGPMVWGVCRRVLSNHHDAEDAFQATFLVLVRKAASIASRELLANWLYGVAHQTAMKAKATVAKRKVRERQATEMPEPAVVEQDLWNDLQPLLDQELSRLPDIYRAVIVLCDLEGKTRKEAARQLSLPEGTVGSRLARARVMLAKRLAQRGVVVSGGALATMLSQNVASAGVPLSVVCSTIKAATLFAAGQAAATGVISAPVVALTEGVLKAMMLNKFTKAAAVLLVVALVCTSVGLVGLTAMAGPQPDKPKEEKKPDLSGATFSNIEVKKTDLQELQGTWTLVTMEVEGKAIDREDKDNPLYQLRFTDKQLSQWTKGGRKADSSRMLQLDAGKKPKEIDVHWGIIGWWGIYKVDGDKLTLCVSYAAARPTDYTTKPGSQTLLLVYKRDQKTGKEAVPSASDKGEAAKQDAKPKESDASARIPPDLKEGVRIVFGSSQMKWSYVNEQSPLVVRVQGNWVFLKYVRPQGASLEGLEGCWVNFNIIDWYVIVPK